MKEKITITVSSNKKEGMIDVKIERQSLARLKKDEQPFIGALVLALTETLRGICNPRGKGVTNGDTNS